MKIAIISKSNAAGGGASRFAEDLAAWLVEAGHEVDHLCAYLHGQRRAFQKPLYPNGLMGRLCRYLHTRTRRYGFNEILPAEHITQLSRVLSTYDVVHFHDHYTAFSPLSMAIVARRHSRVFFTAHDCLHFTGGCLYPMGCVKYVTQCGVCPQRKQIGRFDFTRFNQGITRWVAVQHPITYIYPSRWLLGEARKSLHFKKEPVLLPYGFDPRPYRFQSRSEARQRLGLPTDRKIICISSHYLSDRRKGVDFALRAVAAVRDFNPIVLLVGHPLQGAEQILDGLQFWFSGYLESRERLGLIYAAADVFLFCPLQDNLPISVQEAMAAATPIVGFATGGVPDMVENGKSAWLVPTGKQDELSRALREALLSGVIDERGRIARSILLARFSREQCVRAHEAIYVGNGHDVARSE